MLLRDAPVTLLAVLVAIIIGCPITSSALREWMAALGARRSVAVSWIGKWKPSFQLTAIGMMIWKIPTFGLPWYDMGYWLLFVARQTDRKSTRLNSSH